MPTKTAIATPRSLGEVRGFFVRNDQSAFEWILDAQTRQGITGNMLELGVYEGKSAIHMGRFLRAGEALTVCDLFEDVTEADGVAEYIRTAYASLSQTTFERNYLAFHAELPAIVRARTDTISNHVESGSCRFAHVDASHIYDDVRQDIEAVSDLLGPGGVVAFDDYRTEHTPGTAAAVWEAVAHDELHPIALTARKLYGTWSDPAPLQDAITRRIGRRPDLSASIVPLRDGHVIRIASRNSDDRPTAAESDVAPPSRVLRAIEHAGLAASDFGYRAVRLARNDDPGASIRRSVGLRLDAARKRLGS